MTRPKRDEAREKRIVMEAVVDAYGPEEQALGWYYYLEVRLHFPFQAQCIVERRSSPLKRGEIVEVFQMAPEEDCMHEMFVEIRWMERELAVPLAQLKAIDADEQRQEAIADWHYWVDQGYEFG